MKDLPKLIELLNANPGKTATAREWAMSMKGERPGGGHVPRSDSLAQSAQTALRTLSYVGLVTETKRRNGKVTRCTYTASMTPIVPAKDAT